MPDSNDRDERPEPSDPRGRRFYNDIRDDYDDEFGRVRTPAEVAQRRLRIPAVAHIVIGILCLLGTLGGAVALGVDTYEDSQDLDEILTGAAGILLILIVGGSVFGVVVAGGFRMLQIRRRRLALVGAYIVTGLSLAGPYGILFYPFGIWALIVLYQESVKKEFGSPKRVAKVDSGPRVPFTTRLLLVAGEIGCPIMLFVSGMIIWDAAAYPRYWTTTEIVLSIGISLLVAGMFAAMIVAAVYSKKRALAQPRPKPIQPDSTND
jgi:hypothetical protein